MLKSCPKCHSKNGIREAIYGEPAYEFSDESKFYIAGCTTDGPKFVCVECKWGIQDDDNSIIL